MSAVEENRDICAELRRLREEFEEYRGKTDERLARGEVNFATINVKLNWLIGILGSIGVAVLGVALKLLTGT